MRRELWRTLQELCGGASESVDDGRGEALVGVGLDLPLELVLELVDGDPVLYADVRGWRWTTVFDRRPARLRIEMGYLEAHDA